MNYRKSKQRYTNDWSCRASHTTFYLLNLSRNILQNTFIQTLLKLTGANNSKLLLNNNFTVTYDPKIFKCDYMHLFSIL